ncbi:MAG: hypothetical protein ABIQ70_00135 [Dokdonella sp.]
MSHATTAMARAMFGLTLSIASLLGHAASYCVSNATELQAALDSASVSNDDDEIRLRQGIYSAASTFAYISANPGWTFLTGGWIEANGSPCGMQVMTANSTVLDGGGTHRVLSMNFAPPGTPTRGPRYGVWNLSIVNGYGDSAQFQRGGGLQISSGADIQVEIWLDNLIVAGNAGYFGGGADLYVRRGLIRVVNSLFANNAAPTSALAHFSAVALTGDGPNGVLVANSTFVYGTCPGLGNRGCGIGVNLGAGMRLDIVNSLFSNNEVSDINIEGAAAAGFGDGIAFADYSLVGTTSGTLPLTATHALAGDPHFESPGGNDFRLRDDSPFINQGLGTIPIYGYLASDLDGAPRVAFGALDPGAFENQTWNFIFANGFD